mmetsp:Transcript_100824/g.123483  ORF Transcript_100824/g.123483 Transcript_100824/m.123483 type:complete len:180 (+) Transcript_100824:22-561(+)
MSGLFLIILCIMICESKYLIPFWNKINAPLTDNGHLMAETLGWNSFEANTVNIKFQLINGMDYHGTQSLLHLLPQNQNNSISIINEDNNEIISIHILKELCSKTSDYGFSINSDGNIIAKHKSKTNENALSIKIAKEWVNLMKPYINEYMKQNPSKKYKNKNYEIATGYVFRKYICNLS